MIAVIVMFVPIVICLHCNVIVIDSYSQYPKALTTGSSQLPSPNNQLSWQSWCQKNHTDLHIKLVRNGDSTHRNTNGSM